MYDKPVGPRCYISAVFPQEFKPVIKEAARRLMRSQSSYIRTCVLESLKKLGLVDDQLNIIWEEAFADADDDL